MRDSQEAPLPTTAWPTPQVQQERDELYRKFSSAVLEVQQKAGFRSLVLERKLQALSAAVEKKEAQFSEVLAASNLDPAALTLVSHKLEVRPGWAPGGSWAGSLALVGVTCHGETPARPASITPVETLNPHPWGGAPACVYHQGLHPLSLVLLSSEVFPAPSLTSRHLRALEPLAVSAFTLGLA